MFVPQVRGIGRWTADMFAMFHLGRPDVLPVGDLGVRKGFQVLYGLKVRPPILPSTPHSGKWSCAFADPVAVRHKTCRLVTSIELTTLSQSKRQQRNPVMSTHQSHRPPVSHHQKLTVCIRETF